MQNNPVIIPQRGISFSFGGKELGSIIIRPDHIAFIAGNWCKQISRKAKHIEITNLAREHQGRMDDLIIRVLAKGKDESDFWHISLD